MSVVVWAAALTTAAGAALVRGPLVRSAVEPGAPDRTACPTCDAPIGHGGFRKCGCGTRLGAPPLVLELLAGGVGAGFGAVVGARPELVGFLVLTVVGVALATIDLMVHRLPDRFVLAAFAGLAASFVVGAVVRADATRLLTALLGAVVLGACYFVLGVVGAGRFGLGDVKLAVVLGLALGWFGWRAVLVGSLLAFLLNGVVTLALLAARRVTLKTELPFGPFMLAAAAAVVVAAA
ncbi:MAG: prepilin peptidase [Jatrophihabitans sp.]|uniref:prepilin peptidase n=1 Tax=Jatrophihabitans sp. TaxID=1932789 RepID=UPI003F7F3E71